MEFTMEEMMCFNSLLDGKPIAGVPLTWDAAKESEREVVARACVGLLDKGLAKADGNLSAAGLLAVKLLDLYKKAEKKVFLNQSRIGFLEEDEVVQLALKWDKEDRIESVSIQMSRRRVILYALLQAYPDLRQGCRRFSMPRRYEMSEVDFYEELEAYSAEQVIYAGKTEAEQEESRIFFWNKEICHSYDRLKNTCEDWETGAVRKKLAEILEVEADG